MRILLYGATGFIGKRLGLRLAQLGHELVVLARSPERARQQLPFPCEVYSWNPLQKETRELGATRTIPINALAEIDAVINLAGEPVAGRRWSPNAKRAIRESRVDVTAQLLKSIAEMHATRELVVVNASAIGIFGDCGDKVVDESAKPAADFLAQVCVDWEKALFESKLPKARKVAVRIGLVLGTGGGVLDQLLPVFRAGIGGPIGSGKQYMSWIHIDDLVELFVAALENVKYSGPVNAVAPNPVTNKKFTQELAAACGRPAFFPVPSFVLKTIFGESAEVILSGANVSPRQALENGFKFKFEEINSALQSLVCKQDLEFVSEQFIKKKVDEVFPFFSDAKNLETLTPPWLNFRITKQSTEKIQEQTLIDYRLKVHGLPVQWRTRIETWNPNREFVDTQLKGPYAKWHHTHSFEDLQGGTLVKDRVLYRLPFGFLGELVVGWFVRRDVSAIFEYRRKKIAETFR